MYPPVLRVPLKKKQQRTYLMMLMQCFCVFVFFRPRGDKTIFMLNSAEHEIYPTNKFQGPVVQSIVSLMSSLRVISLTVLEFSMYNILIFFAEKM